MIFEVVVFDANWKPQIEIDYFMLLLLFYAILTKV